MVGAGVGLPHSATLGDGVPLSGKIPFIIACSKSSLMYKSSYYVYTSYSCV